MSRATICSVQNPRIKQAIRLRDRRGRKIQERIIVDGWREIERALQSGIQPVELFVCENMVDLSRQTTLRQITASLDFGPTRVTEDVFRKLAFGERADGIVLVAKQPDRRLSDIRLPGNALVGVLESVEKPGNLGAILRSADGAGVAALVVADPKTDLFNPNAIRASLGTVFSMPICTASSGDVIQWLKEHRIATYAARVDGQVRYDSVDYRQPSAIVLGSESLGLSMTWHDDWVTPVTLPMLGIADSLNVSATAAVLFYEAHRQRNPQSDS